jgi:hypothetical protein
VRFADSEAGAPLESQQANETEKQNRECKPALRAAAAFVVGDAGVRSLRAQREEDIDDAHHVTPAISIMSPVRGGAGEVTE